MFVEDAPLNTEVGIANGVVVSTNPADCASAISVHASILHMYALNLDCDAFRINVY